MKLLHHPIRWLLFCCLSLLLALQAQAQSTYTDHKPDYRKWQDSYILDKIEYREDRTVFFFRFVSESSPYSSAIFYSPRGEFPWYLRTSKGAFELKEIRNIRRDGKIEVQRLRLKKSVELTATGRGKNTVFTCEVHFDRLPNDIKAADLIEGRGKELASNHFNCFNIQLKTFEDDLGNERDSEERIKEFNQQHGVKEEKPKPKPQPVSSNTNTKPKPKADPEPEPEPEPEPKPEPEPEPKPEPDPQKPPTSYHPDWSNKPIHLFSSMDEVECNARVILDRVNFEDSSTEFRGRLMAQTTLNKLLDYLRLHPKAQLTLYGHTDIFGPPSEMMQLSRRRVEKLKRWFRERGIYENRIQLEHYGLTKPLVKEGGATNRRVEAKVSCD